MKLVNGKRSQLLEYLMIIAGTGLMALAINSVFDASGMVTGGFSGIAIIIKGSQGIIDGGIPLWVTNMGLNIPLFLIGWKINGFSFVKKALIGEIALSTWLAIEPVWNLAGNDLLLAALYGGVIQGGNRSCLSGRWNNRRNRYDGSYHPEISAAIFNRTDHAGYRCRRCTGGYVCVGHPQGTLCDYCGISGDKSI